MSELARQPAWQAVAGQQTQRLARPGPETVPTAVSESVVEVVVAGATRQLRQRKAPMGSRQAAGQTKSAAALEQKERLAAREEAVEARTPEAVGLPSRDFCWE